MSDYKTHVLKGDNDSHEVIVHRYECGAVMVTQGDVTVERVYLSAAQFAAFQHVTGITRKGEA